MIDGRNGGRGAWGIGFHPPVENFQEIVIAPIGVCFETAAAVGLRLGGPVAQQHGNGGAKLQRSSAFAVDDGQNLFASVAGGLASPLDGVVAEVLASAGQAVEAGDLLIRFQAHGG